MLYHIYKEACKNSYFGIKVYERLLLNSIALANCRNFVIFKVVVQAAVGIRRPWLRFPFLESSRYQTESTLVIHRVAERFCSFVH